MIRFILIGFIALLSINKGYSQVNYALKAETGGYLYLFNVVQVDASPDWKGYYIDQENGIGVEVVNGISFVHDKLFAGIGVGYMNFEGKNGLSIFSDFEFLPIKAAVTPLLNFKIGYSHLWNQYENGTGTEFVELNTGVYFRRKNKVDIYLKTGFTMMQQCLFIPIRIGLKF